MYFIKKSMKLKKIFFLLTKRSKILIITCILTYKKNVEHMSIFKRISLNDIQSFPRGMLSTL